VSVHHADSDATLDSS